MSATGSRENAQGGYSQLTVSPHLMLTKAASSPGSMLDPTSQSADTLLQLDSEDSDPVHEYPWRIKRINPNKKLQGSNNINR